MKPHLIVASGQGAVAAIGGFVLLILSGLICLGVAFGLLLKSSTREDEKNYPAKIMASIGLLMLLSAVFIVIK